MSIFQSIATERVVRLLNAGSPVTGLTFADVTMRLRRSSESFLDKILDADNFVELEDGFYAVSFEAEETAVIGPLAYTISGGTIDQFYEVVDVIAAYPGMVPDLQTCMVYGNLVEITGMPTPHSPVSFKIVGLPKVADSSLVTGMPIRVYSDSNGYFQASMLRGTTVLMDIEEAAVRYQFDTPDQDTVNVIDLLP